MIEIYLVRANLLSIHTRSKAPQKRKLISALASCQMCVLHGNIHLIPPAPTPESRDLSYNPPTTMGIMPLKSFSQGWHLPPTSHKWPACRFPPQHSPQTGEYTSSGFSIDFHIGMSCGDSCITSTILVFSTTEIVPTDGFEEHLLSGNGVRCSRLDLSSLNELGSFTKQTSLGRKGKQPQRRTVHISALLAAVQL
jgi:hypothetical protein